VLLGVSVLSAWGLSPRGGLAMGMSSDDENGTALCCLRERTVAAIRCGGGAPGGVALQGGPERGWFSSHNSQGITLPSRSVCSRFAALE